MLDKLVPSFIVTLTVPAVASITGSPTVIFALFVSYALNEIIVVLSNSGTSSISTFSHEKQKAVINIMNKYLIVFLL